MSLQVVPVEIQSPNYAGFDGLGQALKVPAEAKVIPVPRFHRQVTVGEWVLGLEPEVADQLEPRDLVVIDYPQGWQKSSVWRIVERADDVHDRDGGDTQFFRSREAQDDRSRIAEIHQEAARRQQAAHDREHRDYLRRQRECEERQRAQDAMIDSIVAGLTAEQRADLRTLVNQHRPIPGQGGMGLFMLLTEWLNRADAPDSEPAAA